MIPENELKVLTPYPVFQGPGLGVPVQPPAPVPQAASTQAPGAIRSGGQAETEGLAPNKKNSVFDSILFALLGTPEQLLTDQEIREKEGSRSEAGALAKSGAENPGEAFMGIPSGGGTSFSSMLGSLMKMGIGI